MSHGKKYYFEINNKIYVLNTPNYNLIELNKFMENSNLTSITGLKNNCSDGSENPLTIEKDSIIKSIVDENNNPIYVKYYVILTKNNDLSYNIVVDKNNYLYIIDKQKKYQQISDKVLEFKYEKDNYGNENLYIELYKNNNINLKINA